MSNSTKVLLGIAEGALLLLVVFVTFSGGPMMGGGFMIL